MSTAMPWSRSPSATCSASTLSSSISSTRIRPSSLATSLGDRALHRCYRSCDGAVAAALLHWPHENETSDHLAAFPVGGLGGSVHEIERRQGCRVGGRQRRADSSSDGQLEPPGHGSP